MPALTNLEIDSLTASLTPTQKAAFNTQYEASKKSKGTALALSIIPIIGHLGFGRFYLRQTGLGFLHIGLMVCFVVPGIIYWIVDWFLIGGACDDCNRNKVRELAVQIKAIG